MLKKFLCLFILLMQMSTAIGNADETLNIQCPLTPLIWDDLPFEEMIIKSNNLRRKAGSPHFAEGKFININGKILDSNCVPVVDAVIEIWQADAAGNILGTNNKIDEGFAYSGTAVTNNLGEYKFFTVLPGAVGKQAPRIHFKIKHSDFLTFESYMYFPSNRLNNSDYELKNIVDKSKKNLLISSCIKVDNDLEVYSFDINLEGINKYKRY